MKEMTIALIVSTYNSPAFLRLCLESVAAQRRMPDEILVADDGSGEATAQVVKEFSDRMPGRVRHIWHEDMGFRLGAIRNKAIAASRSDYIIQIDGDIILHPAFVADHERFARNGSFVTGSRKLLDEPATTALVAGNMKLDSLYRNSPLRCYPLTLAMQNLRSADGTYVRGCHMAFWRADLMAVNGYNEDICGWGREDSEISWRLMNYGLRKRFLKFGAVEFHLYHPENSREQDARNMSIMEQARMSGITRIPNGIVRL